MQLLYDLPFPFSSSEMFTIINATQLRYLKRLVLMYSANVKFFFPTEKQSNRRTGHKGYKLQQKLCMVGITSYKHWEKVLVWSFGKLSLSLTVHE